MDAHVDGKARATCFFGETTDKLTLVNGLDEGYAFVC
jgi:hypothetical protein